MAADDTTGHNVGAAVPHISLVTLGVENLATATAFYQALGWQVSSYSVEGEVTFLHGTPVLALFGRQDLSEDARVAAPPAGERGSMALAMNMPTESDVDRFFELAERAGATVTKAPQRAEWGGYSGYFADLDGHLWEVAYNADLIPGPDGRVQLPDGPGPQ